VPFGCRNQPTVPAEGEPDLHPLRPGFLGGSEVLPIYRQLTLSVRDEFEK
jgi:hypothetical protein